jgi:hypothetical protein
MTPKTKPDDKAQYSTGCQRRGHGAAGEAGPDPPQTPEMTRAPRSAPPIITKRLAVSSAALAGGSSVARTAATASLSFTNSCFNTLPND